MDQKNTARQSLGKFSCGRQVTLGFTRDHSASTFLQAILHWRQAQ
jgi:hypothetical protein